jgi:hypothetical protein
MGNLIACSANPGYVGKRISVDEITTPSSNLPPIGSRVLLLLHRAHNRKSIHLKSDPMQTLLFHQV